jgi:hypothetical protein
MPRETNLAVAAIPHHTRHHARRPV